METTKGRRSLSTGRVVFIVIAAAAPMAAMVGNVPIGLMYGNGAALPVAFVIALAVLLCFSVGYAQMSRRVVNSGAFYTYVARALGKPLGVGAAYVALTAYTAMAIGLAGGFGYFMEQLVIGAGGPSIPWFVFTGVGIAIVGILGFRSVDLSSKVLGILMVAEFAILAIFAVLVVGKKQLSAFPLESFSGTEIASGPIGIALIIAFTSFIGFESAALYGEETKDPERSIPRATYIAVSTVGVFYVFISWVIVGSAGAENIKLNAAASGGEFVLDLINQYGGEAVYSVAAVLVCTSVLASYSALHNAASRYLFALGRESIMPQVFGKYHPEFFSPHVASIAVTSATTLIASGFALSGLDPYKAFAASFIGMGTLGIVALQAAASLSVVAFFRKRRDGQLWQTVIAPTVGFIGLTSAFFLAATNYEILTGTSNQAVNLAPYALLVVGLIGVLKGIHLRRNNPAVYARLASSQLRGRKRSALTHPAIDYSRTYCLVGAGPAGLVMARALIHEGVNFEWYERHSDVGGIWDIDNPGSPMYESAHFISSKYTSGFIGFPMPSNYPDYPTWRQIRDYIRDFAKSFGLSSKVILNTSVKRATPIANDRWEVELSTGEVREFDGLLVATGTNWYPNLPEFDGANEFTGTISHSVDFRESADLKGKRVLVIGAGNSGVDIACDAARNAQLAFMSVRRGYRYIPKHIFGLPTDALLSGLVDPPKGVAIGGDANKLIDTLTGDLTRLGLPAPDHDVLTSHPIMNTQVLHHLAHGDLIAKPDVLRITKTGVDFVDGSHEEIDHIILATGYNYSVPFLDDSAVTWTNGRPDLYLRLFSRQSPSLYFIGFAEFADAAYKRFEDMAQMIIMDIRMRETGNHFDEWSQMKKLDTPDLSGGHEYVASNRHTNYIDVTTYREYLSHLVDHFEFTTVDETTYQELAQDVKV
jgi:amino acid transporter